MNKGWKIALGILVLVVAFVTGFFAGTVYEKCSMMKFFYMHRCMPAPHCCGFHRHGHPHHHRMCPPAPKDFRGGAPEFEMRHHHGDHPSPWFGEGKPKNRRPEAPKGNEKRRHIRTHEVQDFPKP